MTRIALIFLALGLSACAGSLEAARPPRALALSPAEAERCASLDDRRGVEGGLAKAFALAGGTSGLSTIPMQDAKGDRALAIGAVAAAAIAVGLQFMSDAAGASWARECSK